MIATLLFLICSVATAAAWSRAFRPVPWRITALLLAVVALYNHQTLFTSKVDVPGRLLYVAQPWQSLGRAPVHANTGISIQEMVPWTDEARRSVRDGEWPFWQRSRGGGGPLLAQMQTAILHPFTLAGLWLPSGKAWTLSVSLRLWFLLFFTFVLLRNWDLSEAACVFGAIAYSFSTFHIIWLVISIGLSASMLPFVLAAVDEFLRRPSRAAHIACVLAFSMLIVSGHPETIVFAALVVVSYGVWLALTTHAARRLVLLFAAGMAAMMITSVAWYPSIRIIRLTDRYQMMQSMRVSTPQHQGRLAWVEALIAPNAFGTPQGASYEPPTRMEPDRFNDYGEMASGYAGLLTLALALTAFASSRSHRLVRFSAGVMLLSFLTISEFPGWYPLIRAVPPFDLAILQRWRFAWSLGVVLAATVALDGLVSRQLSMNQLRVAAGFVLAAWALVVALHATALAHRGIARWEWASIALPAMVLLGCSLFPVRRTTVWGATALTFLELLLTTWHYNPVSRPRDVFPETGAISVMARDPSPHRMVATGWSLIPDTPGAYGLEDVKTTDPFASAGYLRLFRGYFATAGDFDQLVQATKYGFTDFANVRYIYVPPGASPERDDAVLIYKGSDGAVYRNPKALDRWFLPRRYLLARGFEDAVARLKSVPDWSETAFVDRLPDDKPAQEAIVNGSGRLVLLRYRHNSEDLDLQTDGPTLMATSEVWWPGWTARWNGRQVPLVKVNGAFVGVFVPEGKGVLRLSYRPDGIGVAAGMAVTALAGLMLGYAGARRGRGTFFGI